MYEIGKLAGNLKINKLCLCTRTQAPITRSLRHAAAQLLCLFRFLSAMFQQFIHVYLLLIQRESLIRTHGWRSLLLRQPHEVTWMKCTFDFVWIRWITTSDDRSTQIEWLIELNYVYRFQMMPCSLGVNFNLLINWNAKRKHGALKS